MIESHVGGKRENTCAILNTIREIILFLARDINYKTDW